MQQEFAVVYITAPTLEKAHQLASALVEARLAACINIVPGIHSHYIWKGEVCSESELLLVVKTRLSHLGGIEALAVEITGYEVPEVIAMPIVAASDGYMRFLGESC
ncbi:divalent-cation tolerance protein CutA [Myxococcota bacterium]|nr:divalent-cation tolerance protein CutA [Myxococcota bacterium]MBU1537850.1 divalent-cation tolerance protein CutA [Myxococcota bacterium]